MRVNEEQEGKEWMQLIQSASRMEAPPLPTTYIGTEKVPIPRTGSLDRPPSAQGSDKLPAVVKSPDEKSVCYIIMHFNFPVKKSSVFIWR